MNGARSTFYADGLPGSRPLPRRCCWRRLLGRRMAQSIGFSGSERHDDGGRGPRQWVRPEPITIDHHRERSHRWKATTWIPDKWSWG